MSSTESLTICSVGVAYSQRDEGDETIGHVPRDGVERWYAIVRRRLRQTDQPVRGNIFRLSQNFTYDR